MNYFTSDLHLGHKGIMKYRKKEFYNYRYIHDIEIIEQIFLLGKRDILFILGDFIFDCKEYDNYVDMLRKYKRCRIKLIMGNHDSKRLYSEDVVEMQLPFYSYKNMWLSHCPIHPQEMRNRVGNIHGHLHDCCIDNSMYFNVNLDVNNYKFVPLDDIKAHFNKR